MKEQQKTQNLFLFTGENRLLMKKKLEDWRLQCVRKYGELSYEQKELKPRESMREIIPMIETPPFLSEKKMIVLRGVLQESIAETNPSSESDEEEPEQKPEQSESLMAAFQNIPEQNMIIVVSAKPDKRTKLFKFLQKTSTVKEFENLRKEELTKWIQEFLQEEGRCISHEGAEFLKNFCGENMHHLSGEMMKLVVSSKNGEMIAKAQIERLCIPGENTTIFQFTDRIGERNQARALQCLQNLMRQGAPIQMIFFMMVRQLRLMIQVKELINRRFDIHRIQSRLKLAPFQVNKLINQVKPFTMEQLKTTYGRLFEVDVKTKTGKIPMSSDQQELFLLVLERELMRMASRAFRSGRAEERGEGVKDK